MRAGPADYPAAPVCMETLK